MKAAVKRMTGAAFLIDMRGFWADERVDGDLWPKRWSAGCPACQTLSEGK